MLNNLSGLEKTVKMRYISRGNQNSKKYYFEFHVSLLRPNFKYNFLVLFFYWIYIFVIPSEEILDYFDPMSRAKFSIPKMKHMWRSNISESHTFIYSKWPKELCNSDDRCDQTFKREIDNAWMDALWSLIDSLLQARQKQARWDESKIYRLMTERNISLILRAIYSNYKAVLR